MRLHALVFFVTQVVSVVFTTWILRFVASVFRPTPSYFAAIAPIMFRITCPEKRIRFRIPRDDRHTRRRAPSFPNNSPSRRQQQLGGVRHGRGGDIRGAESSEGRVEDHAGLPRRRRRGVEPSVDEGLQPAERQGAEKSKGEGHDWCVFFSLRRRIQRARISHPEDALYHVVNEMPFRFLFPLLFSGMH